MDTQSLFPFFLWVLKIFALAVLIGIPLMLLIAFVSNTAYNKFGKKIEKSLEEKYKNRGFTLIEILVVLVILGLLAAIIIPRVTGRVDEAKIDSTKIQMRAIKDALEQYRLDNGRYPTTEQGLRALVEKPQEPPEPKKWRQYLDKVPTDAWDNEFIYISPSVERPYELRSKGPDGEEDTEDDIDVWSM